MGARAFRCAAEIERRSYLARRGGRLGDCRGVRASHRPSIASLPPYVYRRTDAGRIEDTAHPVNRLIRQGPNPAQSWPDFIEWLLASTLLRGNGLAEILTDGRGAVIGLQPIPWP